METIEQKYRQLRDQIKDGDLILFRGKSIISKIIQTSDKNTDGSSAYHNHIGVVFAVHGSLFINDANRRGVFPDRLSTRIKEYKGGDFTIIRPVVNKYAINYEMKKLIGRADNWIKYDYTNGIKELFNRRWGFKLKIRLNPMKDICSDYVSEYAVNLNIVTNKFTDRKIQFPEDYIRYINGDNAKLIGFSIAR
jgi:hypothetical protein